MRNTVHYTLMVLTAGILIFVGVPALTAAPAWFSPVAVDVQVGDPDIPALPFKPGDAVFISTFPDTSSFLNGTFAIDDRGFCELPIIGKIKISELSKNDLIKFLKENFSSYLPYPNIYVKPMVRVSLLGGFTRPGLYYVDVNSSLWDIVHKAGGTLSEDGVYEMKWERDRDERADDLAPLFERGISLRKMGFRSGDQIWTPSPGRRTFWDAVRDVMPILTFATSMWAIYSTYQRDLLYFRRR